MSRTREAIREELLMKFVEARTVADNTLPALWLHEEYLPGLSLKEERSYEAAIGELVDEGLIEYVEDYMPTYRLTHKGMGYLN